MAHKFNDGDRIRLTEGMSEVLPFLMKGAVGTIQKPVGFIEGQPQYFVAMDPVDPYEDDDLDFWIAEESKLEAE